MILNTAPAQPVKDGLLEKVELITPNEIEAEILTGIKVDSEEAADRAAEWFFRKGVKKVLITLGEIGAAPSMPTREEIDAFISAGNQ